MTTPMDDARILDRGYRRYTGPRLGVRGAVRSLMIHSIQRAFGVRRTIWAKVLPILIVAAAYVPAAVFIGLVALLPDTRALDVAIPEYGDYYGFILSVIVVFVALVAPEVLCPDRRTGILGLYLASPLDRTTYLAAKAASVAIVLGAVTLGPPLLLLVANVLQGRGPDGPGGVLLTALRILGSAAAVTGMFTALSLAISSLTDRKAFAAAAVFLAVLVTGTVTSALVEEADAAGELELLSIVDLPFEAALRIHGEVPEMVGVTTWAVIASIIGWTVVAGAFAWWRYQRIEVTR
jgi:ABC-2 type transport system permease protein